MTLIIIIGVAVQLPDELGRQNTVMITWIDFGVRYYQGIFSNAVDKIGLGALDPEPETEDNYNIPACQSMLIKSIEEGMRCGHGWWWSGWSGCGKQGSPV